MKWMYGAAFGAALLAVLLTGCGARQNADAAEGAPPPARVVEEPDLNIVKVDRPERFAVVTAGQREALPQLHATGVITADI